jgi:long-chain acyl-CoA synthetase
VGPELRPGRDLRALGRTAAFLAKQVELALAPLELSPPQYRVLAVLEDRGATIPSRLATDLVVRPPSVTAIVDGLVAKGLVLRSHGEDDRRRVRHELTEHGRAVLARADQAVGERLEAIAASLGDAERAAAAVEGLAAWREALRAFRQAGASLGGAQGAHGQARGQSGAT